MSTLILSLLLLVLIAVGLLMGAKVTERFENPENSENPELQATVIVSPALKNMMLSSVQAPAIPGQTELSREQDLQNARNAGGYKPTPKPKPDPIPMPPAPAPPGCPVCPTCPDMSQYIRLDEVPCWNCTLP